jgi:hypothetical protein
MLTTTTYSGHDQLFLSTFHFSPFPPSGIILAPQNTVVATSIKKKKKKNYATSQQTILGLRQDRELCFFLHIMATKIMKIEKTEKYLTLFIPLTPIKASFFHKLTKKVRENFFKE